MRSPHCIYAALGVWLTCASAPAAQTIPPADAAAAFTIFLRAQPIGSEQITLARSADGWSITGSGRVGAPLDVVARRIEV